MTQPGALATAPAHVVAGTLWVMARHVLVGQAIAAALECRIADVRQLPWAALDQRAGPIDTARDLVLVVDDRPGPDAAAAVTAMLQGAACRTLVITAAPRSAWGALVSTGTVDVTTEPPSIEELVAVLARVGAGESVLGEDERAELRETWDRHVAEEEELLGRMASLSARELAVLEELASGRRASTIGEDLGVAESTVRTHIRSIRRKLGVDSQLRAVLVAHRLGFRVGSDAPGVPSPRRALD